MNKMCTKLVTDMENKEGLNSYEVFHKLTAMMMAAGYFILNHSKLLMVIGFEDNGSIKEGTFVLSFKNHECFF